MASMGTVVTVDPGCRGCGVTYWYEARLTAAAYIKNPVLKGQDAMSASVLAEKVGMWVRENATTKKLSGIFAADIFRLVVEVPRIYPAGSQKGDQNDLIGVALVAGAVASAVMSEDVIQYFPREWKGTAKKEDVIEIIKSRIDSEESKAVILPRAQDLAHNVWDSVGIGLHYFGRLLPARKYHKE